ncbi:uncharacterized protein LOC131251453 isoform X2 [Magnolia sinica]|uniref:uncharacterized protein LOC131251453 isoform X2 n=2 Tax=Magnolia sinica TaxID=86752 RepID=UPI00265B01C1|nr:uncharacterized protein LOC131251453 isoform X2 [Magnolia sinica]
MALITHTCDASRISTSSWSMSNPSRALDGVHGLHRVPHSPFSVHETSQHGDCHLSTCDGSEAIGANQRLLMSRMWQQRPSCLRPIHCCLGGGDQNLSETIANVLTSLPFIVLGIQAPRKNLNGILYANSLIGVGVASSLYHSSRGEIRKYLRWADYTMIATTTVCLSRAIGNENPKLLMAASALCLPFQPLMVSVLHTGMMEVAFARRALTKPELRMAHNLHKMSSLLGGVLFVADDFFPQTPYIHAAWHLAAAIGVGTCHTLLE